MQMRIVSWNVNGLLTIPYPLHFIRPHRFLFHTNEQNTKAEKHENPEKYETPKTSTSWNDVPTTYRSEPYATHQRDTWQSACTSGQSEPVLVRDLKELLDAMDADIICMQEHKATKDKLDRMQVEGYDAFVSFCTDEKRKNKAYSGTITYCKRTATPIDAYEGMANGCTQLLEHFDRKKIEKFDMEGRVVVTDHEKFVLINSYVPNAGTERETFKVDFMRALLIKIKHLIKNGREVIWTGDINTAPQRIDHGDPDGTNERKAMFKLAFEQDKSRIMMSDICFPKGPLIDLFRHFYPDLEKAFTVWNTITSARDGNFGTRIDLVMVSKGLIDQGILIDSHIWNDVYGSDHCPISAELALDYFHGATQAIDPPKFCAKYQLASTGTQTNMRGYFASTTISSADNVSATDSPSSSSLKRIRSSIKERSLSQKKQKSHENVQFKSLYNFFQSKHPKQTDTLFHASVDDSDDLDQPILPTHSELSVSSSDVSLSWRNLLDQRPNVLLCTGHNQAMKEFKVNKPGPNRGREFYCCSVPPPNRCKTFCMEEKYQSLSAQTFAEQWHSSKKGMRIT